MSKQQNNEYLNATEFREEIIACHKTGEVSNKLGKMFQLLCWKNSGAFLYVDNDDRSDCIATAVLQCMKAFKKYDPDFNDNAFSYFTSVAINGLRAGWNKLHRNKSREYRIDQIFKEE